MNGQIFVSSYWSLIKLDASIPLYFLHNLSDNRPVLQNNRLVKPEVDPVFRPNQRSEPKAPDLSFGPICSKNSHSKPKAGFKAVSNNKNIEHNPSNGGIAF